MNFSFKFFFLILLQNLFISQNDYSFLNEILKNYSKDDTSPSDPERIFQLPKIVYSILKETISDAKQDPDLTPALNNCITNIVQNYSTAESISVTKLYEGSSKAFIDLSGFSNCIDSNDNSDNNEIGPKNNETEPKINDTNYLNKEIENNKRPYKKHHYYTVYPILNHKQKIAISKFDNKSVFNHSWIFGFCVSKELCEEEAFKEIVIRVNKKFRDNKIEVFNEYYDSPSSIGIINNIKEYKKLTKLSFDNFLRSISCILMIIQILFIFIKKIPQTIFGIFIKRKYLREIKNDPKKIGYLLNNNIFTKKINTKIRNCFSLSDNLDYLITNKKNDELFKDEDLIYLKGIKGLGIVFFIFGTSFIYFFNYPICISESSERKKHIKSYLSLGLVFFWRISPALLLSSSGFSLCYKFLNFLDKKLVSVVPENIDNEDIKDINNDINKENKSEESDKLIENKETNSDNITEGKSSNKTDSTKNKGIAYYENSNSDSSKDKDDSKTNSKSYFENTLGIKFYENDIAKKALNSMFKNQRINDSMVLSRISTSKIPFSILINFFLRQIHKIFCLFIGIHFFKRFFPIISSFSSRGAPLMNYLFKEIINKLDSGIGNFFFYQNFFDLFKKHGKEEKYFNEHHSKISLLQVFSIIICETNYFIIGTILIFISYKKKLRLDFIIIFLIIIFSIIKIVYNFVKPENNPGMFYFDSVYQKFFFNPIFNFNYFLIGLFFGIVNYVVQNDISKKEAFIKERPMVNVPIDFSKLCDYKKRRNFVPFILSIIFLIIFFFIFPYFFKTKFEDIITNEDPSILFVLLSSIDMDCFLFLFYFIILSCYISERNIFFKFFNSNIWVQISKLYFWFVLLTPIVSYYIIYKTETQLSLGFFIVMIYGAICGTNVYIISVAFFVILELPYKKLIKLYFNISSKLSESDVDEEGDDDDDENKYRIQNDSMMKELNEKDLENEINEEKEKNDEDDDDLKLK